MKARRLVRLDLPGYRNSTFALLLASDVVSRREYALTSDRCIGQLKRLRIQADGATGANLWPSAATLGGDMVDNIPELPPGADLLATRYAMETLLAARLILNHDSLDKELAAAVTSIAALPKSAGHWRRHYDLFPQAAAAPAPSTQPGEPSAKTQPSPDVLPEEELAQTLRAIHLVQSAGPKSWAEQKPGALRLFDRLAVVLCGLSDVPFEDRPGAAAATAALPDGVRAVWTLYPAALAASAAKPAQN
jgi:hypothetical protein